MRARRSSLAPAGLLVAATLTGAGAARAASVEVKLTLPVRARLDLANRHTILPAPFIVVRQEGEGRIEGSNIDVQQEFQRYLLKILKRDTDLDIVESGPIDYPTYDLRMLARDAEFWRVIG